MALLRHKKPTRNCAGISTMVSRPEHEPEVIGAAYAAGLKAGRDLTVLEDACPHPVVVGALSWAWLEGFAAGRKDMGQREH